MPESRRRERREFNGFSSGDAPTGGDYSPPPGTIPPAPPMTPVIGDPEDQTDAGGK
jgi:hypothetical protein